MRSTRVPRYASTTRSKSAPTISAMSLITYAVLLTGAYFMAQTLLA